MRRALLPTLLLTLTACGGGGSEGYESAAALADAIGCQGFKDTTEEMFTDEGGSCTVDGEEVSIYTFTDNETRDSYLEVAEGFGGRYLVGDGWLVEGSQEALAAIQEKVGGEL